MSKSKSRYLQRGLSDLISHEDIVISQYMNQLNTRESWEDESKILRSPYSKILGNKTMTGSKSSTNIRSKKSTDSFPSTKRIIAWNSFQSQVGSNEDAARKLELERQRPASAPVRSHSRSSLLSVTSSDCNDSSLLASSELSSSCRMRRKKPLYKQRSKVLCVRAFVNGDRDHFARVTAPDLKQLLEECTAKLGLVSAARKLYLSDGTPVKQFHQIKKNSDIYVSSGEAFKDPFQKYKEKEKLGRLSTWTMNGIIFPESKTRGKTKPSLSQRMKVLVEKQKRRVLVFANEDHANGKEIVAGRFDEFLDDCTRKLDFESGARALYDWDGKEIGNFSEVPVVDNVLQPTTNTVIGPLWVTRGGEKFSYKGPCGFVETLLQTTKERLKDAKDYENQLELRLQGSEDAIPVEVMSFTVNETGKELQQVRNRISDLESVIPKLKSRKKHLQLKKREEEMNGANDSSFKFQNITEIEENSRLLGKKGIRLKVYENGKTGDEVIVYFNIHEASKGVSNDPEALLGRLLDAITAHPKVLKQGHGPAGRPVARRIYRDNGKEVLNVRELKTDDCIWLSFGEQFKPLYTYALQLVVDKANLISLWNERKIIQREALNDDVCAKEQGSSWTTVDHYPSNNSNYKLINFDMEPGQRLSYARGLQANQINEKNTFIQYEKNADLILYPEISVEKKLQKNDNDAWPPDSQKWAIHKNRLISSRAFPHLCLSLTTLRLNINYPDGKSSEGFVVKLEKRNVSNQNQLWNFTASGDVCSLANPSLVLSWIMDRNYQLIDDDQLEETNEFSSKQFSESPQNTEEENQELMPSGLTTMKDIYDGEKYSIAVLPKFPAKHSAIGSQRWALKQESLNNIGQWKYSQVSNPEWNRRALSWPVMQDGTLNEDFKWPMEGFLICNAPPMKQREGASVGPPVRLRVLKNGENDVSRAVTVIGPDLGNMARDISGKPPAETSRSRKSSPLPSSRNDIRNLELNLFLDRCTEALQLPFAARRLFDQSGTEILNLTDLERNQNVFVSCGEAWIDFKTSQSEQQRRLIMTNLAADVAKLRHYCSLRNPQDLVLTAGDVATTGSPVCVASCILTQEERDNVQQDNNETHEQEHHNSESDSSLEGVRHNLLSAHERAHVKAEERLKTLQWPWETAITTNGVISVENKQQGDFENDVVYSNSHLHKRYRHHSAKHHSIKESLLQPFQWFYKDGFFHVFGNNQLVLGIGQDTTKDKFVNEVVLCKKKLDEANQRWTIADDGTIHLCSNPTLTLTVSGPRLDTSGHFEDNDGGYGGCAVLVMPRKPANGNANQLWSYDSNLGLLFAFAADSVNKEITAANKAGICTYAVMGSKKIPQIGYILQDESTKNFFCEACGRVSRGKYRLQKLEQSQSFFCSMGEADKQDKVSCFQCLSNKVDMMSDEADATLAMWEDQLKRLRKITSVRCLNKEIQAAQSVPAVRIRAYKNGEGSRSEPVLVIGSTVDSLLVQCTGRLGLATAARRLYTIDGEHITDINQLREGSGKETGNNVKHVRPKKVKKRTKNSSEIKPVLVNDDAVDTVYTANQCKQNDNEGYDGLLKTSPSTSLTSTTNESRSDSRYATDMFVSCGEPFIPLEEIDRQYFLQRKHQIQRTWVENHLETEKHVLRQMQGRRISARLSSEVLPGRSITPSWQDLTRLEENKQENIEELTEHLKDLKSKQQQEKEKLVTSNLQNKISTNKRLYNGVKTVRIDVYENGDSEMRGASVCGSSLLEILNISTTRLGLTSAARRLFTTTGQEVYDVSELVKGENYCVSCGENFIQARDRQKTLERKATWSRLNRQTGGAMAYKTNQRTQNSMLALPGPPFSKLTH